MTHQLATESTSTLVRSPGDVVREHTLLWTRASSAEASALDSADRGLRELTVAHYREALTCYDQIGSSRDSARVRLLLRELGVRIRHWSYQEHPVSGWASLTSTEAQITELVALGLTNRQVAAEMFISAHTVAFHLRQVFRKLHIRSRVELARLAAQREYAQHSA
jgi:DNA-binding CsgD family transcriptional regulator